MSHAYLAWVFWRTHSWRETIFLKSKRLYLHINIGFVLPKLTLLYLRMYNFAEHLLVISRIARSRRATARPSYRSNLISSARMRRTASAERCGSDDGIVADGSFNFGHGGLRPVWSIIPMSIAINQRTSCSAEGKNAGAFRLPKTDVRSIRASLMRRTRRSSSSASAATRACSRVMASAVRPAILRASWSTCLAYAAPDWFKARPWLYALRLARLFPAPVRGPVLFLAFWNSFGIVDWYQTGIHFFMPISTALAVIE